MPDQIATFDSKFPDRTLDVHAALNASSSGDLTPPGPVDEDAAPVVARVNAGRWIADCPATGCEGAEYVSFTRPTFFCCECRNEDIGSRQRPVTLPDDRESIEAALLPRIEPRTRNWVEAETVADLLAENADREGDE